MLSEIYAITPDEPLNIKKIEQVIKKHNINILQYRRKINSNFIKEKEARLIVELCNKLNILSIINDDVILAHKTGASGVHLGKNDSDILGARKILGKQAIIGVSCYNDVELAKKLIKLGADYCGFGSVFSSKTKPNAKECDLKIITKAKNEISVPIVAIGGIDFENYQQVLGAGADSVAMISALWSSC